MGSISGRFIEHFSGHLVDDDARDAHGHDADLRTSEWLPKLSLGGPELR